MPEFPRVRIGDDQEFRAGTESRRLAIETPLRAEHERAGARMGLWFGTMLPSAFGDSAAEYRCGRSTVAVVDTNFQLVAELRGPDRIRYLNAITSGNIVALQPGQSTFGLLLNPQGHILAELRTLALDDRLLVLSHATVAERTLSTIDKFIIMDDVELIDRSAEFGTLAFLGSAAGPVLEATTGVKLESLASGGHIESAAGDIPCRVLRSTFLGLPGVELLLSRERITEFWSRLVESSRGRGGAPIGYEAVNVLRLEAGVPWFGVDFGEQAIPHEAGLENSHISYTKGCYTGQEIVERVRSRGHANRRLLPLAFSGDGVPEAGAKLSAGDKEAGTVTSAAFSPSAGRAIGLGYLRREFHAVGTRLQWAGGEAEVTTSPTATSPR